MTNLINIPKEFYKTRLCLPQNCLHCDQGHLKDALWLPSIYHTKIIILKYNFVFALKYINIMCLYHNKLRRLTVALVVAL